MKRSTTYKDMTPEQKERAKEAVRRWRQKNRERVCEIQRRYRQRHPEETASQRANTLEATRRYRERNKEKRRKQCREWHRSRSAEWHRLHKLHSTYQMRPEEYAERLRAQGGVCAVCGQPETVIDKRTGVPRELSVDHEHTTGCIRGLLCIGCNIALGHMHDSPDLLRAAADYLETFARQEHKPPSAFSVRNLVGDVANREGVCRQRVLGDLKAKLRTNAPYSTRFCGEAVVYLQARLNTTSPK